MNIIETGLNAIRLPGVTNVLDEYRPLKISLQRWYIEGEQVTFAPCPLFGEKFNFPAKAVYFPFREAPGSRARRLSLPLLGTLSALRSPVL
jgi:hypothetical protein